MKNNPFAGMENAEVDGPRDPFLTPRSVQRDLNQPADRNIVRAEQAQYVLKIDQNEYKSSRKKGDFFLTRFTVVASNGVAGDGSNPIGSRAVHMTSQNSEYFQRDVAALVCAAMNVHPKALTEGDYELVVSSQQPIVAAGRYVEATVDHVKTKQGKDFTRVAWAPIECVEGADGEVRYAPPEVNNVRVAPAA